MTVQHDHREKFIIQIAICPVGVFMHLLLLIAFLKDPLKCFRNSGTYLVGNLAVSDFLACLLAISRNIIKTTADETSWSRIGDYLWIVVPTVSYTSIVVISIDRFFMVVYPLQHRSWMKEKSLAVWIACIWFVSFIFPTKKLVFGTGNHDVLVGQFVGLTGILFSAITYALTYFKLRKQTRNIALDGSSNTNDRAHAVRILKEKKFLTTIIVIACVTLVCNVPFLLFYEVVNLPGLLEDPLGSRILMNALSSFFYCNFAVNPFIYIARLPNYRKTFYLLYCKRITLCCKTAREEAQQT